jgi:outer membrane protein assembly factor BamB
LNPDNGSQIWKTVGHGIIETSPVVYGDKVIVGGINVSAFKVTDGSPVWHFKDSILSPTIYTSPALNSDKIYLGNVLFYYCLNAEDGLQVWKNQSTHGQNMSGAFPKIAGDKCYFGNSAGNLYGLNLSTGSEGLVINIGSAINITPEVDITNNRIYVGTQSANNSFRCYNLNGTELWKTNIGIVMSSPTLADNKIYVMGGSTFHCLSASDGSVQWTRTCRAGSVSKPVVLDGKVYFGDGDELLCLNASDGKLLWQYIAPGSPGFGSPTIVGNRLYVGTVDSKVYCFKID